MKIVRHRINLSYSKQSSSVSPNIAHFMAVPLTTQSLNLSWLKLKIASAISASAKIKWAWQFNISLKQCTVFYWISQFIWYIWCILSDMEPGCYWVMYVLLVLKATGLVPRRIALLTDRAVPATTLYGRFTVIRPRSCIQQGPMAWPFLRCDKNKPMRKIRDMHTLKMTRTRCQMVPD